MPVGGAALDLVGVPLPEESFEAAKQSDAILLGAIGGYVYLLRTGLLTHRSAIYFYSQL